AEHDGANPRKLMTVPDNPGLITFSPDGIRISFTLTNQINNTSVIWEARSDGSNPHPLLTDWNNPPAECCGIWTPDGDYFIFVSSRNGDSNLWIMPDHVNWWRKSSREPVQLTTGPLQFTSALPSKDGKKLFVIGMQLRAELTRYDAKSGELVPFL